MKDAGQMAMEDSEQEGSQGDDAGEGEHCHGLDKLWKWKCGVFWYKYV
jgi:hypothetical protein